MPEFAAAVTCIDGRFHGRLADWAEEALGVRHVDLVTGPGISASLAAGDAGVLADVGARLAPSLTVHRANTVVVAAHEGCAGDPATPAQQRAALPDAAARVRDLVEGATVVALYLHADGRIETIPEPAPRTAFPVPRSTMSRSSRARREVSAAVRWG